MNLQKLCCYCVCLSIFAGVSATGQENPRAFLSRPGEQSAQPTSGNTVLTMSPGETATVHAFLDGTGDGQLLQGYQLIWRDAAVPQGAATGSIVYVDLPPIAPAVTGNSILVDPLNVDFVLQCSGTGSPFFNETLGGGATDGFGLIQSLGNLFSECAVPSIRYLAEFQVTASADACGEFELAWVPFNGTPAGGAFLNVAAGAQFFMGTSGFQDLTIIVGGGDDCAAPNPAADGSNDYINGCATEDGSDGCFAGGDTWYTYTATCTGNLRVNVTSGEATPAVYDAEDACSAGDDNSILCGNGGTSATVFRGQDYIIQINGDDSGTFEIGCRVQCTPGHIYTASNGVDTGTVVQDCVTQAGLVDGIDVDLDCTNISCNSRLGCVYVPASSSLNCNDWDICTQSDRCSGEPLNAIVGGGSCTGNLRSCFDFDSCTVDYCDQDDPKAQPTTGCVNQELIGADCSAGGNAFCQSGGNAVAFCDAGVCVCGAETTFCTADGSAAECADVVNNVTMEESPDGITDDVCVWWQCGGGACIGDLSKPCDSDGDCDEAGEVCVFIDPETCIPVVLRHPSDMGGVMANCEPDGLCNNSDINAALLCFASANVCPRINVDAGGPFGSCRPDGFCNVFDANHVGFCFTGANQCNCSGGPAPEISPRVVGGTSLTLESSNRTVRRGATFQVHAYINSPLNALSGYQLHAGVSGGRGGSLELVDVSVADRDDCVFVDAGGVFEAFNIDASQMLSGLHDGHVATVAKGYLATFTYRVSDDAVGTFVIDILHDESAKDQSFLIGAGNRDKVEITDSTPAVVVVTSGTSRSIR